MSETQQELNNIKIITWNVNGIRSLYKDAAVMKQGLDSLGGDIICLQEARITRSSLDEGTAIVDGYNSYYGFPRRKSGYSGVATYCKDAFTPFKAEEGLSGLFASSDAVDHVGCYGSIPAEFSEKELKEIDFEGRAVITQHKIKISDAEDKTLVVINVYCPRADLDNTERLQVKLRFYHLLEIRTRALLESGNFVVIVGDINTCHKPIDHCDPSDMMEKGARIVLLLIMYTTCGTAVESISVTDAKPSNSGPDISGSSISFSMPVQYSMAAPAVASAQLAAASLTSIAPSHKMISTTQRPIPPPSQSDWIPKPFAQRSKPLPDVASHQFNSRLPYNRRISFAAGYSVSEPQFESHKEYAPQYHHKPPTYSTFKEFQHPSIHQSYPSAHDSYISYTPPPSSLQYHQQSAYTKPYFLKHFSHYNSHAHDLLDFPIYSHEGSLGENSSSYYKFMFPLALLGLGIPAIGLMYTYLSRRRRRDLNSDFEEYFHPSSDDLQYYLNILQSGLQHFQENVDNKEVLKQ